MDDEPTRWCGAAGFALAATEMWKE